MDQVTQLLEDAVKAYLQEVGDEHEYDTQRISRNLRSRIKYSINDLIKEREKKEYHLMLSKMIEEMIPGIKSFDEYDNHNFFYSFFLPDPITGEITKHGDKVSHTLTFDMMIKPKINPFNVGIFKSFINEIVHPIAMAPWGYSLNVMEGQIRITIMVDRKYRYTYKRDEFEEHKHFKYIFNGCVKCENAPLTCVNVSELVSRYSKITGVKRSRSGCGILESILSHANSIPCEKHLKYYYKFHPNRW